MPAGAAAQNGLLTGTVEVVRTRPATTRSALYRPRPAPAAARTVPEESPAVVWLEAETARPGPAPSGPAPVLNQLNKQFVPGLLVIRQGQTVHVLNADPLYHNVFSLSPVRPFDVGRRRTGETVEVRFERPGVVDVFCDIHSHMNATILVLSDRTVAAQQVAPGEPFRLDGLRPGTYRLNALTRGADVHTRDVTVTAGQTLDVGAIRLEIR